MNLNEKNEVFCHGCNEWYDINLMLFCDNFDILCTKCLSHLGYVWDCLEIEEDLNEEI